MDSPWLTALYAVAGLMVLWLWCGDYRSQRKSGAKVVGALPGAYPASLGVVLLAVLGALALVAMETLGEIHFGLVEEQSVLPWYAFFAISAAALVEELIFRGYLVITSKGRILLVLSIVGFSILFAVIHPFLWSYDPDREGGLLGLHPDFSFKAWYSTAFIFAASLWFYTVRFLPSNPRHSLLPCFAAHLAANWAVFAVKWQQGYISGLG